MRSASDESKLFVDSGLLTGVHPGLTPARTKSTLGSFQLSEYTPDSGEAILGVLSCPWAEGSTG